VVCVAHAMHLTLVVRLAAYAVDDVGPVGKVR
jgi:hypothetical protein